MLFPTPQVDLEGVVAHDANFFTFPIQHKTRSIMIIGRTFSHVAQLYTILVGKGLPVKMHGMADTGKLIKSLFDDMLISAHNVAKVRYHVERKVCAKVCLR